MNTKTTCSDIGYECTMQDKLSSEKVPIYRYESRPAEGVDARPGDTVSVRVGDPIGYKRQYIAYRECSHCGRREEVGTKTVPIDQELTFEDFLIEKSKEEEWKKKLEEFDMRQKEERERFIRKNHRN